MSEHTMDFFYFKDKESSTKDNLHKNKFSDRESNVLSNLQNILINFLIKPCK